MKDVEQFYTIMHRGYIRDGKVTHIDDAMMLACLYHSKGKSRKSDDMVELQKILGDKNLDSKK